MIIDAQKAVRGLALLAWNEWLPETAAARWMYAARSQSQGEDELRTSWAPPREPVDEFTASLALLDRSFRAAKSDRRRRERARRGFAMVEADRGEMIDGPLAAALSDAGGVLVLWRLADRCTDGLGMETRPEHGLHLTDDAWHVVGERAVIALTEGDAEEKVAGSACLLALTAAGVLTDQWPIWRASILLPLLCPAPEDGCRDPLLLLLAGGLSETGIATAELHAIAQSAPIYDDADLQPFVANHPAATPEVHHALGAAFARAAHWAAPKGGADAFLERCTRILGPGHPVTAAALAAWPARQA
jgi:hypothetical protein